MVNVGDTVYFIYVGYVTVINVFSDGELTIHYKDKNHVVRPSQYRTLDRMASVRFKETIPDYTI